MVKTNRESLIGILILSVVVIVLLCRCFFDFNFTDESFYLAMADRLWKGDRLVLDEWNPSQFFFPLLLPVYSVYRMIVPSGDSVYLFFRLFAVILSAITSVYIFLKLKKTCSVVSSLVAALVVLLYSRGNIFGVSYYNIFVLSVVLAFVCFFYYRVAHQKRILVLSGMSMAIATCAMPFFIVIDFGILIYMCLKKAIKQLAYLLLGVALVAIPYLIYLVLTVGDISLLLHLMPMLLGDSEHSLGWFRMLVSACKNSVLSISTFGIMWIVFASVYALIGNAKQAKRIIICGSSIAMLLLLAVKPENVGKIYVIVPLLFFPYVIYTIKKGVILFQKYLVEMYFLGFAVSLCFASGSNVNVDAMSTGMVLSAVSVILIMGFEKGNEETVYKYLRSFIYAALCVVCLSYRVLTISYGGQLLNQTTLVETGPAKGLHIEVEREKQYESYVEMIRDVQNRYPEAKTVFYSGMPCWLYVASDLKCGTLSVWGDHVWEDRFNRYYKMTDNRVPEIIMIGGNGNPATASVPLIESHLVGEVIYRQYESSGYDHLWYPYANVYILAN